MKPGRSDLVLVFDDAEIDKAVESTGSVRLNNAGQFCASGKRAIVDDKIYDEFLEKLITKLSAFRVDDPLKDDTKMGPLVRVQLSETIEDQLKHSTQDGDKMIIG